MAIRQSDSRFIMEKIVPALLEAEKLSLRLDGIDALRSQAKVEPCALSLRLREAIDETILRIHHQGSGGYWQAEKKRMVEIQGRCAHKEKFVATFLVNKDEEGRPYHDIRCRRCSADLERKYREAEPEPAPVS